MMAASKLRRRMRVMVLKRRNCHSEPSSHAVQVSFFASSIDQMPHQSLKM